MAKKQPHWRDLPLGHPDRKPPIEELRKTRERLQAQYRAKQEGRRLPGRPRLGETKMVLCSVRIQPELKACAESMGDGNIGKGLRQIFAEYKQLKQTAEQNKEDNES